MRKLTLDRYRNNKTAGTELDSTKAIGYRIVYYLNAYQEKAELVVMTKVSKI